MNDDDDLDDTVTAPPRPLDYPARPRDGHPLPEDGDVEDTFVPERPLPELVQPASRPRLDEPSGIELTPEPDAALPDAAPRNAARPGAVAPSRESPSQFPEPRSSYFRFRIGRTVVWLDAVAYVGRRPSSPRIIHGRMPRLVRVQSPGQEVSSTHIEVRQLGASVVITDMRSTNGSVVFPPGGVARKLRQGESVVVAPGTLVDIGDGNVMEILPLELRAEDASTQRTERGRP